MVNGIRVDRELIFSGELKGLTVTTSDAEREAALAPVTVKVSYINQYVNNYTDLMTFTVVPLYKDTRNTPIGVRYSGEMKLDLSVLVREALYVLTQYTFPTEEGIADINTCFSSVQLDIIFTQNGESTHLCDNDGNAPLFCIGDPNVYLKDILNNWGLMSLQPQVRKVYPGIPFFTHFIANRDNEDYIRRFYIDIYFRYSSPITRKSVHYTSVFSFQPKSMYFTLAGIESMAVVSGRNPGEIVAFDIYMTNGGGEKIGAVQRYVVSERGVGCTFAFVNPLGMIETIDSGADGKTEVNPEISSSVIHGVERELTNTATVTHEDGSGLLTRAEDVRFWGEFLKSARHWVWQDGEWLPVILDEAKAETTEKELNEISFKWHFADRGRTLPVIHKELEPFYKHCSHEISEP